MPGDYSRLTYQESKRYTGVRMQQGRVQLDSDWNEQADITRHALESALTDVLGSEAADENGFKVTLDPERPGEYAVGSGHFYADGLLCANDKAFCLPLPPEDPAAVSLEKLPAGEEVPGDEIGGEALHDERTPDTPNNLLSPTRDADNKPAVEPGITPAASEMPAAAPNTLPSAAAANNKAALAEAYLVYLEAWQQEVTAAEDEELREVALGGIDTTARTQTLWEVHAVPIKASPPLIEAAAAPVAATGAAGPGGAALAVGPAPGTTGAAAAPRPAIVEEPEAIEAHRQRLRNELASRGRLKAVCDAPGGMTENQLYRVEIHRVRGATVVCKWSRDNGSVAFPVEKVTPPAGKTLSEATGLTVKLRHRGADRDAVDKNDLVELIDQDAALRGDTLPLLRVDEEVNWAAREVKLRVERGDLGRELAAGSLQLRHWDGELVAKPDDSWVELENGLKIQLAGDTYAPLDYHPGDYWLIPTRVGQTLAWSRHLPPHGPERRCALLAVLQLSEGIWEAQDCRPVHAPATDLTQRLAGAENAIAQERIDRERLLREQAGWLTERIDGLERTLAERIDGLERSLAEQTAALVAVIEQAHRSEDRLTALEARWFEERTQLHHDLLADEFLEDGDVVALLSEGSGERGDRLDAYRLVRADRSNAYQVYGVVITNDNTVAIERYPPGSMVRVAVYGRVRCNVVGRVSPGDLLVPSRRAGYAQRAGIASALLRPGTVIGKALTASDPDRAGNTIDMIVTLG